MATALTAAWVGLVLSGCAAGKSSGDTSDSAEDVVEGDAAANDFTGGGQSITDGADDDLSSANTNTGTNIQDAATANNPENGNDTANKNASATDDNNGQPENAPQGTSADTGSLYEQFLKNEIAATVTLDDPSAEYRTPPFERGNSYTFDQLGHRISEYFLDPEYSEKTSYDYVQYAYLNSADGAGTQKLLLKFVGLNIYTPDDDSYAVAVLSANNGQLSITAEYECWARSETIAYSNGALRDGGSSGAGDHYSGISVLLSDGTITPVYGTEELYGPWTRAVSEVYGKSDAIYGEVFGDNAVSDSLIVSIDTIGDKKYYQYAIDECTEEQKILCETYINRCHDELGINWVSAEEVQAAIQARCAALGVDVAVTTQQPELIWNNLE